LLTGEEEGGVGEKPNREREKACSSINHSILSGLDYYTCNVLAPARSYQGRWYQGPRLSSIEKDS